VAHVAAGHGFGAAPCGGARGLAARGDRALRRARAGPRGGRACASPGAHAARTRVAAPCGALRRGRRGRGHHGRLPARALR
jgi:hypothetical protein